MDFSAQYNKSKSSVIAIWHHFDKGLMSTSIFVQKAVKFFEHDEYLLKQVTNGKHSRRRRVDD